jgi:hypothetical protein
MSVGPLLAVAGVGLTLAVILAFWAMLQNWMAGVIQRAQARLGRLTHTLQSALVILDRIVVNSQRLVLATGRVIFREITTDQVVTTEEVRRIDPQALPAEVLAKLDSGQSVSYQI